MTTSGTLYTRMLEREATPDIEQMRKFIGDSCIPLFDTFLEYVRSNFNTVELIKFYSKNYGWAIQFKKGKSKTLLTVFPESGAFTTLFTYGAAELSRINESRGLLSPETALLIDSAVQYHDGKWIYYRVTEQSLLRDLYILTDFKSAKRTLLLKAL